MKLLAVLLSCLLMAACASGPAVSKSRMGNCQVEVVVPKGADVRRASVFLDDLFIGNASKSMPVLQLRRGERTIRVEMPGFQTVEVVVTILGE